MGMVPVPENRTSGVSGVLAPAPITARKWTDVEDEDDDDYYATMALLKDVWGLLGQQQAKEIDVALEEMMVMMM
ncbi:hypothetical protein J5N97_020798 [Dioscorea zingiberensis]|uniref:Uncharacterized protein n=1 Tax=Dioscorea zingiberensis TaxID=325984 RepID=A0A9D5CH92_9LILI|nr:hypothetical protein J5N97_020798 [Dioscorea zingiberensis]